jgi:mRNA-degrading endonuclease RelE of RelBE toxin-antitoxin system
MYRIQWEKKAVRQLKRFQVPDRLMISESVMNLEKWPDCPNVKSLVNHKYGYRLRVGRFRIFFDVETTVSIVSIEEVKKRDEHTY